MTRTEAHEYAKIFPMASQFEISDMADDIKARGLLNPIVMLDGKILDGRNRSAACELAGVTPQAVAYTGTDPLGDVISWNLHRRQLTASQKAMLQGEIGAIFEREAKAKQESGKGADGSGGRGNMKNPLQNSGEGLDRGHGASDKIAKVLGVSHTLVEDAKFVTKHAPELVEKIKAGDMTVNAAKTEVKQRQQVEKKPQTATSNEEKGTEPKFNSNAMQFASEAINQLRKIKINDPVRHEAFRTVTKWVTDNE